VANFALRIYSHPHPPDYFQVYWTDAASEDIGNAYKRSTALRVYVTLDLYTRQAVRPRWIWGVKVKMVSEHEYAVPITHLLSSERL
jgi:hypothetical protein